MLVGPIPYAKSIEHRLGCQPKGWLDLCCMAMKKVINAVHHRVIFSIRECLSHCVDICLVLAQHRLQNSGVEDECALVTVGGNETVHLPPVPVRGRKQFSPRGLVLGSQLLPHRVWQRLARQGRAQDVSRQRIERLLSQRPGL